MSPSSTHSQSCDLSVELNLDHSLCRLAIREALQLLAELQKNSRVDPSTSLVLSQVRLRLTYFLRHSDPHQLNQEDRRCLLQFGLTTLSSGLQRYNQSHDPLLSR